MLGVFQLPKSIGVIRDKPFPKFLYKEDPADSAMDLFLVDPIENKRQETQVKSTPIESVQQENKVLNEKQIEKQVEKQAEEPVEKQRKKQVRKAKVNRAIQKAKPKTEPEKITRESKKYPETIYEDYIVSFSKNKDLDKILLEIANDVKYVSLPEGTPEDVIRAVKEKGVAVELYKNEADRIAKIKKFKKDLVDGILLASSLVTPAE